MRIAVISDIHGHLISLEAVLDEINKRSVDSMICCGDITAFGPRPLEVLDMLGSQKNIQIIRGNTDRWMEIILNGKTGDEEKVIYNVQPALKWTLEKLGSMTESYFQKYPPSVEIGTEGLRTYVRHAGLHSDTKGLLPGSDLGDLSATLEEDKCDIFLCGHTHIPFTKKKGRTTFVNAGSTAYPFDSIPRPSWALLEIENKTSKVEIFRVDYDIEESVTDLKNSGMPMADVFIDRIRNARM